MSDKNKQKKYKQTSHFQMNQNDGWNIVSQKKQTDKQSNVQTSLPNFFSENIIKNIVISNKNQNNHIQELRTENRDKDEEIMIYGNSIVDKIKQADNKSNVKENISETNTSMSRTEDTNQVLATPTDKFNQFRERLNEQTKRYYYFDKQFFKIYNCQQINGLDSNQITKLKDENSQLFQDLRNIILSYINYNGGIIFFGFNHIKKDNIPHMEVNGFIITKADQNKYEILKKTLETITSRITPNKINYDLSIMKVRKDKNSQIFTQEKFVARIIVQQGEELQTLYVYKDPKSIFFDSFSAKYSKKDSKFIVIKGTAFLYQASDQKKQLTKVKSLKFTHIDDFLDPQSSYVNMKNQKSELDDSTKRQSDENDSFKDSKSISSDTSAKDDDIEEKSNEENKSKYSFASEKINTQNQSEDQIIQETKEEASRKCQESTPSLSTNKENCNLPTLNSEVGQWNQEIQTDEQFSQKAKQKENNQKTYLLQTQMEEEIFTQINLFEKQSLSQIGQQDQQSSIQPQELSNQMSNFQKTDQQNNTTIDNTQYHKLINKINENQTQQNAAMSSIDSNLLAQQAYFLQQQQQQQQQILSNQLQQQLSYGIPNQNQYKIPEYQQKQQQQQQVKQNHLYQFMQPQIIFSNPPHPFQVYQPIYMNYQNNSSNTPNHQQIQYSQQINFTSNCQSKFNGSLKFLKNQELLDIIIYLEGQVKNYQDYLFQAKIEEQNRKIEQQIQGQLQQNLTQQFQQNLNEKESTSFHVFENGYNFSSTHSNSSLIN